MIREAEIQQIFKGSQAGIKKRVAKNYAKKAQREEGEKIEEKALISKGKVVKVKTSKMKESKA